MRSESSKAFALPTEEPKHELWAKYDEAAASIFSKSDQPVSIRHISWHQVALSSHLSFRSLVLTAHIQGTARIQGMVAKEAIC